MAAGGAECCGFCVRVHVGVEVRVHRCACACAAPRLAVPTPSLGSTVSFSLKYHPHALLPPTPGEIVPPPDEVTHANEQ